MIPRKQSKAFKFLLLLPVAASYYHHDVYATVTFHLNLILPSTMTFRGLELKMSSDSGRQLESSLFPRFRTR